MRLVLVHGFTQNRDCWSPFDELLRAAGHDVVAIDVPPAADIPSAAQAIAEQAGRAVYVGYSQGGRLALRLALDRPDVVAGLVMISASPGLADAGERAARARADAALAHHIETVPLAQFLDEWLAQPLFATLPRDRAHLDARLRNEQADVAAALRALGVGTQEPLWHRLGELTMPVLIVTGALDRKYVATGRAMADAIGTAATVAEIADAGHTTHLEQPEATAEAVHGWLAGLTGRLTR